jgi:hypothetical protein
MSEPSSEGLEHLTDADVAAYLDRGLATVRRDRIEAHLAGCAKCRREVLETQQLVKRVRPFPRTLVFGGSVAAAAAVLLLVAKLGPGPGGSREIAPVVRADDPASRLVVYGPTGENTSVRRVNFVWGAAGGAVTYRLTLTSSDGAAVWTRSGTDTAVALPDSIVLRPGRRYLWVADALLADGATRSTGVRELVLAR